MKTAITKFAVATKLMVLICMYLPMSVNAQAVLNANNSDIDFGGAGVTITNKVGTGTSAGDVVLYEDVISIGGTAIDAIVRIKTLSGTISSFDNESTSGAGMSNNAKRFFSPKLTFPTGGGICVFTIEFIEDNSYDNAADTGTLVLLQNVKASTYDIDRNSSPGANEFMEFGGYDTIMLSSSTNVVSSFNFTTGLTKFKSGAASNISNIFHDFSRVTVSYPSFSEYDLAVGTDDSGTAQFFVDFGGGASWTGIIDTYYPPVLDLDTASSGNSNMDTICSQPLHMTTDGKNINSPGLTLAAIRIAFDTADIADGAKEKLVISGATSGDSIALNFTNGQSISNIVFQGVTYNVSAIVEGSESVLNILPSSGTVTLTQAEAFMDSLLYYNPVGTTGLRTFKLFLIDNAFASIAATFMANVNCGILPVSLVHFNAQLTDNGQVAIAWTTASEENSSYFVVQRSQELEQWEMVEQMMAAGYSKTPLDYHSEDMTPFFGTSYYRLKQVDYNDAYSYSDYVSVVNTLSTANTTMRFDPINKEVTVQGQMLDNSDILLFDALGRDMTHLVKMQKVSDHEIKLDLSALKGLIVLRTKAKSLTLNLF